MDVNRPNDGVWAASLLNRTKVADEIARLAEQARTVPERFRLTERLVCRLHIIAMSGLVPEPGCYRQTLLLLGDGQLLCPHWIEVPARMRELCRYVNEDARHRDPVHLAAFCLWRIGWLQPFLDGNKRVARAVCTLLLAILGAGRIDPGIGEWDSIGTDRHAYEDALEAVARAQDEEVDFRRITPMENVVEAHLRRVIQTQRATADIDRRP